MAFLLTKLFNIAICITIRLDHVCYALQEKCDVLAGLVADAVAEHVGYATAD